MGLSIMERARRYLAKYPPAISGQSGHDRTFHVAALLVNGFGLCDGDALALLQNWNLGCQPPWSERELRHKLDSALKAPHTEPRGHMLGEGERRDLPSGYPRATVLPARGPVLDPKAAAERFLRGFRCSEMQLAGASKIPLEADWRFDGALMVNSLYQPQERVNFVTEFEKTEGSEGRVKANPKGLGITLERDALSARFYHGGTDSSEAGAWLRMNPVDGNGVADANVTALRYTLFESDSLPLESQLALFVRLPLPVAAILSSGGRSYHAWVRVDAADADEYRQTVSRLFELVGRFGMDKKNKNPSRLSRLPGAKRSIGAVGDGIQRLLYLNPEPEQRRILE